MLEDEDVDMHFVDSIKLLLYRILICIVINIYVNGGQTETIMSNMYYINKQR